MGISLNNEYYGLFNLLFVYDSNNYVCKIIMFVLLIKIRLFNYKNICFYYMEYFILSLGVKYIKFFFVKWKVYMCK